MKETTLGAYTLLGWNASEYFLRYVASNDARGLHVVEGADAVQVYQFVFSGGLVFVPRRLSCEGEHPR